jgi:hypothetical protein
VSFIDWVERQNVTHSLRGSGFWVFTSSIWFLFSGHDGLGDGGHGPMRPSDCPTVRSTADNFQVGFR